MVNINKMNKMDKTFSLTVTKTEEAGYKSALIGLSYNKNQPIENMPELALKLSTHDHGHNKFLEQIYLWIEVTAPRYWWQEGDTYRLSTKNSQSTMHTILKDELNATNFECEDIGGIDINYLNNLLSNKELVLLKRKLPEGFMQKRMWTMNYKCLRNIIIQRQSHRLPHWPSFINQLKSQVDHPELLPFK